jgi:hypothetical protein
VRLLHAVASAVKRLDPGAEIVSAGLPQSNLGVPFGRYLSAMYRAGAARAFDTLAIHPYALDARGVVDAVAGARRITRRFGDRPPIWVTELGWASGGPRSPFTVGERGQGRLVGSTIDALLDRRGELGVRGVVYYDWRDARPYGHDFFGLHTGLLRLDGSAKPALAAFERAAGRAKRAH